MCVATQAGLWVRDCFYTLDMQRMTHAGAPILSTFVCLILMRHTMKQHIKGTA